MNKWDEMHKALLNGDTVIELAASKETIRTTLSRKLAADKREWAALGAQFPWETVRVTKRLDGSHSIKYVAVTFIVEKKDDVQGTS